MTATRELCVLRNLRGGVSPEGIRSRSVFPYVSYFKNFKKPGRLIAGLFFCAALLLVFPFSGSAEDIAAPAATTQIITDQESGTVTIVIEGEPALLIDKTGLHVVGDIAYGGTITDAGQENVMALIESDKSGNKEERADEKR